MASFQQKQKLLPPMNEDYAPGDLVLEEFLPYRLSVLTNRISQTLAGIYQERFGITIPEWRVMAILGRHAPLSSNLIAERGRMDKAKVSRAVSRLLDAGMITRETDPRDNRLLILKLSTRGKRIYAKIAPLALAWEQELMDGLDDQDKKAINRILNKLSARIDDMQQG